MPGREQSDICVICNYALDDRNEILAELRLIDPDVIICGGTFAVFSEMCGFMAEPVDVFDDDLGYRFVTIEGRERLVIDYWHPANRYPAILNYYGITGICQSAIQARSQP